MSGEERSLWSALEEFRREHALEKLHAAVWLSRREWQRLVRDPSKVDLATLPKKQVLVFSSDRLETQTLVVERYDALSMARGLGSDLDLIVNVRSLSPHQLRNLLAPCLAHNPKLILCNLDLAQMTLVVDETDIIVANY
jgi:hypothetical protein